MFLGVVTFLERKKGNGKVCHIWNGEDTACRMFSTGGLNPRKYHVVESSRKPICTMCQNVVGPAALGKILESMAGNAQPLL